QFNQIGIEEAASLGMNINFSVMDGFNDTRNIDVIKRGIVLGTNDIPTFVRDLRAGYVPSSPLRFMQVTLDQIYSPDKKLQEKNLGELLERINYVGVNTVFVQGYSDPDGDGKTSSLYFPNRILPMKADLLNRVLHQIKTRTEAENAFAMMPLLSFVLPDAKETGASLNSGFGDGKLPLSPQKARSLSPFDPKTTETVLSIFEDLARTVHFAGVYFHESSDIRDFGPDAVQAFKTTFNEEFPPETVNSKRLNKKWEKFTAERLMMLSKKISEAVLYYRPAAKFLRSMSADQLSGAESEARFSQNYSDFLEAYDYVVLNASPSLNRNTGPAEWVKKISTLTGKHRHGTKKTLFTLQSFDLKTGTRVAPKDFFDYARLLYSTGIKHAGYTRGDLFKNQPPKDLIRRTFSLRSSPFYP
ncbi:MAG: poly-beta-1,6-N-acetyl-D-glucosamine N-deacetylase PgaB, partial [Nitrospinota bacterium]